MVPSHLPSDPFTNFPTALGLLWLGTGRSSLSLASRSTLLPAGAIFKDRFKAPFRGMGFFDGKI